MLVSIILPIYKVEDVVVRCIESVVNQTYRQLEIIIVDDCSPDSSMILAEDYIQGSSKAKDLHFIFIKHDYNMGLSAARNSGIKAATGDYVFFLDSDDEIVPSCIEVLVANSENGKYDVVDGDFKLIGEDPLIGFNHSTLNYTCNNDVVNAYVNRKIYVTACNKLVRRCLLLDNMILFKEGIVHEDELWSFILVNRANSYKTISEETYIYYRNANSITTNGDCYKKYCSLTIVIKEMVGLLCTGALSCYEKNYSYIQEKRAGWMLAILRSHMSLKEKLSFFKSFLNLPIGGNVKYMSNMISMQTNHLLYPYRRSLSLWIRKFL